MDWGNAVRALRARTNMKQEALADLLNVSQAFISRLEAGRIEPSADLRERLLSLIEDPAHRSVFDHIVSHVRRSPDILCIVEPMQDSVRFIAISAGFRAEPTLSPSREGVIIDQRASEDVLETIRHLRESGVFTGDVEFVDSLWVSYHRERPTYWRSVQTPLHGDDGRWYLHCALQRLGEEEYRQALAERARPHLVKAYR